MIGVLAEVGSDIVRFGMAVWVESIRRAVEAVKAYYPGVDIQVVHPIDPEAFFVRNTAAPLGVVELEMPESVSR